ncbi:chemotaxis protein CheA [Permianibacter sp. IMCC34836]|uniref:chemotaxis protein CheA n=1 Tax=Permianibacter fluminis TaxID=2738515 RepID=UPI001555DDC2|nr:chemotaxis protein CheA [Permianibacter fluminis]NQD38016.1 chemotaxis protein CheA [Permianibacter fluminis]
MALDADEEILQDFLVEAGEILELLSEQLVKLERSPDDLPLLNAIFRGFHTVKGGAGFLKLTALVEVCHLGENIFDKLRNQELRANAQIMDQVLQVLDVVNRMFDEVRGGNEPVPADPAFLEALHACAEGKMTAEAAPVAAAEPAPAPAPVAASAPAPAAAAKPAASGDITDAEFESLLDELQGSKAAAPASKPAATAPAASAGSGDISDQEFDALLDSLHGKGKAPVVAATATPATTSATTSAAKPAAGGDTISDDEFDKLLDQLDAQKKSGAAPAAPAAKPAAPAAKAADKPAKASAAKSADAGKAAGKAGETISDNEFDDLLDQLHGKGKAPTPVAPAARAPAATPAPAPAAAAATPAAATATAAAGAAPAAAGEAMAQAETTVRVDTKRLDDIMNLVGELVLVRNRLLTLANAVGNEDLGKAVQNLDVVTSDLQGAVMQTRMQPIKKVFGRFPRVVRDLARSLKKEINLELIGEETDLDKNMVEALADPLVHLVRNAVDHGIEMPDEREKSGKDRTGKIILSAAQEGDHILLEIRDDGKGMDPAMLRRKAVEKGLMDQDQAERLSDVEAFNLIFMAGFSTKAEVSEISGRGVGMDVVKTRISQLNGSVSVLSEVGKGSLIQVKLPLTLAILPTLMVSVHKQVFALPLASVNEIFHLDLTKTNVVDGQLTLVVRGKALPLFHLEEWLVRGAVRNTKRREGFVVIAQIGSQRVGFVVDALIGQQEVVIKPLGKSLQGTPGMAGATITSDGGIALILDMPALLKQYARRSAA